MTEPITRVMKIEGYRPGVYISNVCAIAWAADLRKLLEYDAPQARKQAVLELIELLERVK